MLPGREDEAIWGFFSLVATFLLRFFGFSTPDSAPDLKHGFSRHFEARARYNSSWKHGKREENAKWLLKNFHKGKIAREKLPGAGRDEDRVGRGTIRAGPPRRHPHAGVSPCSGRAKWMSNASRGGIVALYIHFARV